MHQSLLIWSTLGVCALLGGCQQASAARDAGPQAGEASPNPTTDAGPFAHDAASEPAQPDAQTPRDDASAHNDDASVARDAGAKSPDQTGHADAAIVDASNPSDAGAQDAGDAGVVYESDAAVQEPTAAQRTDGCPEAAPLPVTRVKLRPAAGAAAGLVGARIQGSNSGPTTNFVDLATITEAPAEGAATTLTLSNTQVYRYLRYYAPPGSQGGLAEVAFFYGQSQLVGAPFGTASGDAAHPYAAALDGDAQTYFVGTAGGGGYVGLDIAGSYVTSPVAFSPAGANVTQPIDVMLSTETAGASIRYSLDGSEPTRTTGTLYTAAIHIAEGRSLLRAVAYSSCRFDSEVGSASYIVGSGVQPVAGGLRSYHLGNSLTDTINHWLEPIADSTGVDHVYARWTIPGAPIGWLATHQGEGFENPTGASRFDSFVQTFAPIDHLSIQPYSDPDIESQGGAAVSLLTTALQYNPNIQFWVYAQWPGQTEWRTESFANGGGSVYPAWQVARKPTTWEEAVENEVLYHEAFRDYVDARVAGKPFLIVPGGLALVELKRQMENGTITGFGEFFSEMFDDEVHLKTKAQYLISLVFYSCLYRQTPESRVTYEGTGLTQVQAIQFQRIAWNVASSYPGSGIQQ